MESLFFLLSNIGFEVFLLLGYVIRGSGNGLPRKNVVNIIKEAREKRSSIQENQSKNRSKKDI